MQDDKEQGTGAPVADTPPLPGGGSYTWSGTAWVSNDPLPADAPVEDHLTTKE